MCMVVLKQYLSIYRADTPIFSMIIFEDLEKKLRGYVLMNMKGFNVLLNIPIR